MPINKATETNPDFIFKNCNLEMIDATKYTRDKIPFKGTAIADRITKGKFKIPDNANKNPPITEN